MFTGGAAKGHLWPQIVADTLGIPLHIPVVKESTALGAAICAGVGAGLWDDTARGAASVAAFERTVEPDAQASAAYATLWPRTGSRSTAARWSLRNPGSCARCGARPEPDR